MGVEREAGAECARARAGGAAAPRGPVRLGPFARVSLLPFLLACGSGDGPPTASEPLPEGVDTAVRGMRTYVTRDGVRRALVEADTAHWRDDNEIHLRRMTLTFFDPGGVELTEVTAEFGIFHQITGDLDAERRVVVEDRVDDQRLETERLRYRNSDGRLLGDTVFQFVDPSEGLTLDGTAFESDPALDSVVVLNQEGEMLPVVALTEAVPLPSVPAVVDPAAEDTSATADAAAVVDPDVDPAAEDTTAAPVDPVAEVPAVEDTTAAATDTTAAAPDTAEPVPDSLEAPPDTAEAVLPDSPEVAPVPAEAVPDSVEAPPDTAAAVPDSVEVPPDTAAAVLPDSVAAPPDTTAARR